MMRPLIIAILLLPMLPESGSAQRALPKAEQDSLWSVWDNPQEADSNRLKAMQRIAWHGYLYSQPDSAFHFAQLQYDLAEKNGLLMQMGTALNTQATALNFQGDFAKAIDYYSRSLKIKEELGDRQGIGASLNNMGNIYRNQGDYAKATDYFFRSLNIREEIQDVNGVASSLGSIATVYLSQADYANAINYFSRCLTIMEELGNRQGIAGTLNNMGLIYSEQGDHQKAIDHHIRSLHIREELGDRRGVSESLTNIGNISREQGNHAQAMEYHSRSLAIREDLRDKKNVAASLYNLGMVYAAKGEHANAIAFGNRAMPMAQEVGDVALIRDLSGLLYGSYKATNRPGLALGMLELFITMRDSILSEENQKEVMRQQFQYDYDKKEVLMAAEQERKDAIAREELARQRSQRNLMGLGFLTLMLAGGGTGMFLHQRRKAEYRYRSARSELKALQAQMRPHFIFNALNSVNNYIERNETAAASDYLIRFSKLMRATLNSTLTEQVTLEWEMASWRNYLELERPNMRHGLDFSMETAPYVDAERVLIPPLLVQPLLENALWHGLVPKMAPGSLVIRVTVDDGLLIVSVEDDGVGRDSAAPGTDRHPGQDSVGLTIVRERIALLDGGGTPGTGLFLTDLPNGFRSEVRLPLVTAPASA